MKLSDLDLILEKAQAASVAMNAYALRRRVALMNAIADEIEALGSELIQTAMRESNLPEARLTGEKARTIFQWRSYAAAVENGYSLDASIDTANAQRTPPKPDIRKTNVALGPVAVFGASNFPFAFSTAGGLPSGSESSSRPSRNIADHGRRNQSRGSEKRFSRRHFCAYFLRYL
jgi:2,5-dioxopentanoate dehydrogenase